MRGITVLNQSVLLANINDNATTLAALSERLFAAGCLPYYLHALDKVRGAHHFAVDDQAAVQLHRELQVAAARLSSAATGARKRRRIVKVLAGLNKALAFPLISKFAIIDHPAFRPIKHL
jgi:L-lysine 2,3-aminomutase